jgi:hypothetical protein
MRLPRPLHPPARVVRAAALLLALTLAPMAAGAQQEERPIAFDSASRMTAITPFLAGRLKLQPPTWPVTVAFREARLYGVGDGAVLVVQREDGTLVRYPLDATALDALRGAVVGAMRTSGNPTGEPDAYRYTEMAGSRFARRQLILGPLLYGPVLASLGDGENSGVLYLLGSGLPALVSLGFAGDNPITRAQADLAMDGAPRFALLSSFAYRAAGGNRRSDGHAVTVLASSLAATGAGIVVGRNLTDGEARGMTWGSNYALAITAGAMKAFGALEDRCSPVTSSSEYWNYQTQQYDTYSETYDECRTDVSAGEWSALVAAGLVGYPLGLQYVRRASYAVTAGDLRAQSVAAGIGALIGAAAAGDRADDKTRWGTATAGLLLGAVAGDRLLVAPFDYTRGQGSVLLTGAIAGGLLGLTVPAAGESENDGAVLGSAAIGAGLGVALAHSIVKPRRGATRGVLRDASRARPGTEALASRSRVEWQLDPGGIALSAARAPGRHGILSLSF